MLGSAGLLRGRRLLMAPARGAAGSPQGSPQGSGGSRPLEGKVAVVTGATAGIGLAVAEALAGAGARVLLSSRRAPNVAAAVGQLRGRGLEVSGAVCHVGREEQRRSLVQQALDTYGGIDILVSNAAVNPALGPALDADESVWEKIFQVNVTAAAMLVKLVVPHMEQRGGGSIVLVSSLAAYRPFPALGPYSVSKAALLGLVKVLAAELRPRHVRVNGVAPGLIPTRFSAALWQDDAVLQRVMSEMGIDRLGTAQDVAEVVTFLCSPAASYVVGETLVVAGGPPPASREPQGPPAHRETPWTPCRPTGTPQKPPRPPVDPIETHRDTMGTPERPLRDPRDPQVPQRPYRDL